MAVIDLKQAELYLRDGFGNGTATPLTTNIEPVGETTIALTDCTVVVPVGAGVKFGTDTEEYVVASRTIPGGTAAVQTITATTEPTGGDYTLTYNGDTTNAIAWDATIAEVELAIEALDSVANGSCTVSAEVTDWSDGDLILTFSAPLEGVVADFVLDDAGLTGETAASISTTTPGVLGTTTSEIVVNELLVATTAAGAVEFCGLKLEIVVGEGNLEYVEKTPRIFRKNRGTLNTVKNDDDEPMDVSFAFEWDKIKAYTGETTPTIENVLRRTGPAAAWTTTASDDCDPFCVDIEIHNSPVCAGSSIYTNEVLTLGQFYQEELSHSIVDSSVSCSGRCNTTQATSVRFT